MNKTSSLDDRTAKLKQLMQIVGIDSFNQLARLTGVSVHSIGKLRSGQVATLSWETLTKISTGLKVSQIELLNEFGELAIESPQQQLLTIQQEYNLLQQQLQQQRQTLTLEFQHQSLQILESFLTYFPTAKHAATNDPNFLASKLFPLIKPIDKLLTHWNITIIGTVGSEIAYDPQWHQAIECTPNLHELVTVRYVGYRQQDKLIFRAKVSQSSPIHK